MPVESMWADYTQKMFMSSSQLKKLVYASKDAEMVMKYAMDNVVLYEGTGAIGDKEEPALWDQI